MNNCMKLFYFAIFFLFGVSTQAQDITIINYGTTIAIEEIDLEFVEVLEDSRCPANVNCIQAGKAVVLVNIYVNGNISEERKLEFHPSGFTNLNINTLFNTNGLRIKGLNLLPYPVAMTKTPKEAYFLDLAIDY